MMDDASVRNAVRAFFTALGEADEESFAKLFTEDVWFCDPMGSPVLEGHAGVSRFIKGMRRAWSRFDAEEQHVYVRGARVAAHWSAQGKSSSGVDIAFDGIDLFEVAPDGRISRVEGYWDFEDVIGQM
jgi:steroid delta-isomerase